jgi:hypothetical protein
MSWAEQADAHAHGGEAAAVRGSSCARLQSRKLSQTAMHATQTTSGIANSPTTAGRPSSTCVRTRAAQTKSRWRNIVIPQKIPGWP